MRIALMVEGQEGVSWEEWLALAEACETHGIEAMFRSDHYSSQTDTNRLATDAWTLLGALAARTSTLRFGTLVSPVTFRHPSVVARAAATVDHVSGGRVEVGMGAGWMELEHERFSFPFPPVGERVAMLAEHLEAVDRLLREDPLVVQEPRPPLIVGGAARRGTAEPAAGSAEEWYAELERRGLAGHLTAGLREFEDAGVERVMLQHVVHRDLDVVAALGELAAVVA